MNKPRAPRGGYFAHSNTCLTWSMVRICATMIPLAPASIGRMIVP
jgi:hypothetical protein